MQLHQQLCEKSNVCDEVNVGEMFGWGESRCRVSKHSKIARTPAKPYRQMTRRKPMNAHKTRIAMSMYRRVVFLSNTIFQSTNPRMMTMKVIMMRPSTMVATKEGETHHHQ